MDVGEDDLLDIRSGKTGYRTVSDIQGQSAVIFDIGTGIFTHRRQEVLDQSEGTVGMDGQTGFELLIYRGEVVGIAAVDAGQVGEISAQEVVGLFREIEVSLQDDRAADLFHEMEFLDVFADPASEVIAFHRKFHIPAALAKAAPVLSDDVVLRHL